MDINPWQVKSIQEFSFLKCPECTFDSKDEDTFQDHAIENHPLAFILFGKPLKEECYEDPITIVEHKLEREEDWDYTNENLVKSYLKNDTVEIHPKSKISKIFSEHPGAELSEELSIQNLRNDKKVSNVPKIKSGSTDIFEENITEANPNPNSESKKRKIPIRDRNWTCPVPQCTTSAKKGFYRIPENPVRRIAWLTACKLPIDIRKTASICWKHFKKSDFQMEMDEQEVNELGMGMLNRNVTPSEFLPENIKEANPNPNSESKKRKIPIRDRNWKCPVPQCTTSAKRGFYTIPENPVRRIAWLTACKLPIDIRKTASICWKHFKKSDFQMEMDEQDVNELGMGMLNRNVTPSEFLPDHLMTSQTKVII